VYRSQPSLTEATVPPPPPLCRQSVVKPSRVRLRACWNARAGGYPGGWKARGVNL
jgi:hypothetical protein